jgi:hypothetical protein
MDQKTVLGAISVILENWENTYIEVGKGYTKRTLALSEVTDQKVIYRYVTRRLKEWAAVNMVDAVIEMEPIDAGS